MEQWVWIGLSLLFEAKRIGLGSANVVRAYMKIKPAPDLFEACP